MWVSDGSGSRCHGFLKQRSMPHDPVPHMENSGELQDAAVSRRPNPHLPSLCLVVPPLNEEEPIGRRKYRFLLRRGHARKSQQVICTVEKKISMQLNTIPALHRENSFRDDQEWSDEI